MQIHLIMFSLPPPVSLRLLQTELDILRLGKPPLLQRPLVGSESAVGSRDLPSLHCSDLVQLNRKPREPVVELSLLRQRPRPPDAAG